METLAIQASNSYPVHAHGTILLNIETESDVGGTSGQKPCTKMIYIASQTSVGLF